MSLTRLKQGFQIGESYLRATASVAAPPIASGAEATIHWTLDDLDGNDLAINGDDTLIDVLTTGWYQVTLSLIAQQSAGGDSFELNYFELLTPDGSSGPFWDWSTSQISPGTEAAGVITTEFREWTAGDQIKALTTNIMTLAGTWFISDSFIAIVRAS